MIEHESLILDFGGVISRTLFECHAEIEGHFGLPAGVLRWRGPLDPAGDELWRAMLAGEISDRDYWHRRGTELGELVGRALEMSDLLGAACAADPDRLIRPEAVTLVRQAKAAGRRVGVLSNDLERLYGRATVARLGILREVDCVVDGSWSRVHKPSPEAYARALAALGGRAERTVFVDDQPHNVAAAVAVGMVGLHFDVCEPARSFAQAERLLGL